MASFSLRLRALCGEHELACLARCVALERAQPRAPRPQPPVVADVAGGVGHGAQPFIASATPAAAVAMPASAIAPSVSPKIRKPMTAVTGGVR